MSALRDLLWDSELTLILFRQLSTPKLLQVINTKYIGIECWGTIRHFAIRGSTSNDNHYVYVTK